MQHNKMKDMIPTERPYEKCERFGPGSLTDIELLAVLLRSGSVGESVMDLAHKLISPHGQGKGLLNIHHWSLEQLKTVKGVGKVKAAQLVCLSELAKRLAKTEAAPSLDFSMPQSIARYYMEELRHKKQEVIKLLLLNAKAKLICDVEISKVTVNSTLVTPRELFIEALQKNAVTIILLHNHPSGDPTPSPDDALVTERIHQSGQLIGIQLLDHIIIGNNCYYSMREKGFFHEQEAIRS